MLRYRPEDRPRVHRILEHPLLAEKEDNGSFLEPDEIWVRKQIEIYDEMLKAEFDLRLRNQVKNIIKKAQDVVKETLKNSDDVENVHSLAPNVAGVADVKEIVDSEEFSLQNTDLSLNEKVPKTHKKSKVSKFFDRCRFIFSRRKNKNVK